MLTPLTELTTHLLKRNRALITVTGNRTYFLIMYIKAATLMVFVLRQLYAKYIVRVATGFHFGQRKR